MRRMGLLCCALVAACANEDSGQLSSTSATTSELAVEAAHGRDVGFENGGEHSVAAKRGRHIWFENTYGGERFFALLAANPDPAKRINVGFANVLTTPRASRFAVWGTINDPDCHANPAGGQDICADPAATGVVGIRKSTAADGTTIYGIACASCHAGFDPTNPPVDPSEPTWDNIHPSIGNQFLKSGAIFAANLAPTDPRRLLFAAWPDGTVDTTLLFNDNIMNPGVITAFWEQPHRPLFDVGVGEPKMRNGQGGEDDLGGDVAAMRVYTNIGVCFEECVLPAMVASRPIAISECRERCPDFPPQSDLDDLVRFLATIKAPKLEGARDGALFSRGRAVFANNCASCHSMDGEQHKVLTNDEVNAIAADPNDATNVCRAETTNWESGHIWAEFSSQVYKDRIAAGGRGYRTMPLTGIWATAPFMHNQSIGPWSAATDAPSTRAKAYEAAMWELLSSSRAPKVNRLPVALGPFAAGTPLTFVFSRDPATNALLCSDAVENHGHYFGASLPVADKAALIEWLKFQ